MTERVLIGDAVLYHGDAYEIVPTLTGIDACVSDPPYGIAFKKGAGGLGIHPRKVRNLDPIHGDDKPFDPSLFCTRDDESGELRVKWPCVLFGGNHFYTRLPDGGTFHSWDKHCGVGPVDSFSDAEFAWASWRGKSQVKRYLWKGVLQDGEKGRPKYHIMQKPIEVMTWCLDMVPNAKVILDPFMGSGSTGVACAKIGRRFIGIEYDRKHFDVACKRIEEAQQQPDLINLMLAPRPAVQEAMPL